MNRGRFCAALGATMLIGCGLAPAARAADAGEILKTFELSPGFQMELVASEPAVLDPVDLKFDERGGAYVLEMGGYPIASDNPEEFPGNIVRLDDEDGDGVYEKRTLFADKFQYACAFLPWRGGFLVASPPDLVFVKDTDGDGRADVREAKISGFAVGNTQHNYNGLTYGLDNWIYAGNGGNSGEPHWPEKPGEKFDIRWRDFRFDLDAKKFEQVSYSTGGYGYAIDDFGRIFTTHNTEHVHHVVFPIRYLARNRYLIEHRTVTDISDHSDGIGARIYAIGRQESRVNHPEQSGYFSGACGITYYGGGMFGKAANGSLFVGDVVLNLVHRDVLKPEGPTFAASRGEEKREFLASTDRSVRPVNMSVGPDGALYVIDFHRDSIEHPEWIPDEIEKDLDVRAGSDKGRIFRIAPKGGLPRVNVRLERKRASEVVTVLGHPNKWWRDTAQRLLVEWQDERCAPWLEEFFREASLPAGRAHAIWTLAGLGKLSDGLLAEALADGDAGVRENALIAAEDRLAASAELLGAALKLADDADARVRMQAALSLGWAAPGADAAGQKQIRAALVAIARRDAENEWTRKALLGGLGEDPLPMLEAALGDERARPMAGEVAAIIGGRGRGEEIATAIELADRTAPEEAGLRAEVIDGIAAGFEHHHKAKREIDGSGRIAKALAGAADADDPPLVRPAWRLARAVGIEASEKQKRRLGEAARVAGDPKAPAEERAENLALAEFLPFEERSELLFGLLNMKQPAELQRAAIEQLADAKDRSIPPRLIEMWNTLGPATRGRASDIFIWRGANHELLLSAIEDGRVLMGQLNLDLERRRQFLFSGNENIRQRAEKLFTDANVVTRAAAIEAMAPAAKMTGDPAKGREHFKNLCMKCHKMGGEGSEVAPALDEIYRKSSEILIHDILDPNAAVDPQYISYTIETEDGQILNGLIAAETDSAVTLREAEAKETVVPRTQIKEMRASGLSLMPEELEKGMEPKDFADLLAYLQERRQ